MNALPLFTIREDDLSGSQTRELLALHLGGMQQNSPPGHVHALDVEGLKEPNLTFWTVWEGEDLVAMGALKILDDDSGELKSMRTHPAHLRKGAAAALLDFIIEVASKRGMRRLSLETGSGDAFEAALRLYRKRGFQEGEAFADYEGSAFNQFLHLDLVSG